MSEKTGMHSTSPHCEHQGDDPHRVKGGSHLTCITVTKTTATTITITNTSSSNNSQACTITHDHAFHQSTITRDPAFHQQIGSTPSVHLGTHTHATAHGIGGRPRAPDCPSCRSPTLRRRGPPAAARRWCRAIWRCPSTDAETARRSAWGAAAPPARPRPTASRRAPRGRSVTCGGRGARRVWGCFKPQSRQSSGTSACSPPPAPLPPASAFTTGDALEWGEVPPV